MLIIKELRWSNIFSYGPDNVLNFANNPLVQFIGKNGHGKSSIALILEEALFNKNSKGIKKADLINRYTKAKSYSIDVDFSVDEDDYNLKTTRGTAQTIKLVKNGEDISAHTATNTYKLLEEILGIDHKAFTQIVYQSGINSLEFLTSTDSVRKKFLIDLLNLDIYTRGAEYFKKLSSNLNKDSDTLKAKISVLSNLIAKINKEDLVERTEVVVPKDPTELRDQLAKINLDVSNIESTNKRINQNNVYINLLNNIKLIPSEKPEIDPLEISAEISSVKNQIARIQKIIKDYSGIKPVCPTCSQPIDISNKLKTKLTAETEYGVLLLRVAGLEDELRAARIKHDNYTKYKNDLAEFEKYHTLIDKSLPTITLDRAEMLKQGAAIGKNIASISAEINSAVAHNAQVYAHNSKVRVLTAQRSDAQAELDTLNKELDSLNKVIGNIQILNKTFSTTGLVAYKIECLIKDLEELVNKYLQELSDGRFQISFEISDSDKLNVIIIDNGNSIDIAALSNGEKARVNVATLLSIRKLLQNTSSNEINLLILDETIESLDTDGKDKLIEVLLNENSTNTILISHGFTHPLLEKVNIIKTNNISRIE